jgi:ParB/RepB/Spo0J family partition protein
VHQIRFIALDQLTPFSKQARQSFDDQDLQALAETIKEYGLRQPLTVLQKEEELTRFEIISGERRYRAARLAGLQKVPCIILADSRQAEEIALIENIQRTDLTPLELGNGYAQLIASGRFRNADEIASRLGAPRSQVFEYLQYARFPERVKEALLNPKIIPSQDVTRNFLRRLKEHSQSEGRMMKLIARASDNASEVASDKSSDASKESTSSGSSSLEEVGSTLVPLPSLLGPPSLGFPLLESLDEEESDKKDLFPEGIEEGEFKKNRDRRRMTLLSISLENGDLRPQLRGLKVCPKYLLPQIRRLLQEVIQEMDLL